VLWDRQEGRDCYDLVEWLAEQEWCTGKVGMSGSRRAQAERGDDASGSGKDRVTSFVTSRPGHALSY
jgi:hypothetical protein